MHALRYQRRLWFYGFIVLLVALLLGFVTGAPGAYQKQWLVAHVNGILTALLMVAIGAVLPALRLSERALRLLYVLALVGNYLAFFVLSVWAAVIGFPLIVAPGDPPEPWQQGIFYVSLVLSSLSALTLTGMVIYGLRGDVAANAETAR